MNRLRGGEGGDHLYGLGGDDALNGGPGNDLMSGGEGDDRLTELPFVGSPGGGSDRFIGGPGADAAESLDSRDGEGMQADVVRCDALDTPVESDTADLLKGCSAVKGWDGQLYELNIQPRLIDDRAVFTLRCGVTESGPALEFICHGRLSLRSIEGEDLGSTTFQFEAPDETTPLVIVAVPLTAAGRQSIEDGAIVEAEAQAISANGWTFPAAGFRAFMRASKPMRARERG
jgi:hypothetical protein